MSDLSQKLDMLQLLQIASGYFWSQALYAATRLRVADALARGPRSVESLARELSLDGGALFRLLRALATQGLFARTSAGEFSLTERGRLLLENHPRSLRGLVLSLGDLPYRAWGSLESSIRTGRPAFDEIYGCSYFDYLDSHPEHSATFDAAMTSQAGLTSDSVAASFDFSRFRSIVDVGGGRGLLLSAILERNPNLKAYVFDRPAVVERGARGDSQVEWVAGDFFEAVLPRSDAYLLSLVLHDWDDEACVRILRNVRRAMDEDARLLAVESILPDDDAPFFAKVLDLHMLACFGGAERTEEEYRRLLEKSGLRLLRVHRAFGPTSQLSIMEAAKARGTG